MINDSNLPPIDPGDNVRVTNRERQHIVDGVVIAIDDGGIIVGDDFPYWVPWSAVGWIDLRKCGRAQKLLADYRRDHPEERR